MRAAAVCGAGNPRLALPQAPPVRRSSRAWRVVAQAPGGALPGRPAAAARPPSTSGPTAAGPAPAPSAAAAVLSLETLPTARQAPALPMPDHSRFSRYLMPDSEEYQAATLGSSTMAKRLRAGVAAAAADAARRPVCVQGEPGLHKHHIAAQIHYSAGDGADDLPLYKLNLAASANAAAVLFGGDGSAHGHGGIVGHLRHSGGSLLLVNVHVVPQGPLRERIKGLLREARDGSLPFRLLMTSEQSVNDIEAKLTLLKVPPLRARPSDVKELAAYYLTVHRTRTTGGQSLLLGTPALRQLQAYQYPVNLEELQMIVDRVAIQTMAAAKEAVLATTDGTPTVVAATLAPAPASDVTATKQGSCGCAGSSMDGSAKSAGRGCAGSSMDGGGKSAGCGCAGSSASSSCCSGSTDQGGSAGLAVLGAAASGAGSLQTCLEAKAALASADCKDLELCHGEFWFVTEEKDRFRVNLLDVFPLLRNILKSGVYPAGINAHITPYVYPLLLAALFFGPQDRESSVALNLVWCYWWPAIFILYPVLGRWWCSVCPFMVTGEIVQQWRTKLLPDVKFLKWPKKQAEEQGPWFVLGLFAAILVWEDVWHLNSSAALTGWLLSLITAGAVACGVLFPKRFWCRYLCPIGGMNGLFAKLSATELRSQSGVCSSECTSYSCLKGAPEGQQPSNIPAGCPYSTHSNSLQDNSICSLCSTCVAMCPHDNVELRLRPPGIDLWALPQTSAAEASLLFLLMGAVFLHREDRVLSMLHLDPSLLDNQLASCGIAVAILAAPGLLLWAAHSAVITGKLSASRLGSFWAMLASGSSDDSSGSDSDGNSSRSSKRERTPPAPFVKLAYSYVPLVWGATLAYYSEPLLREAGTVLQVGAVSLGMAPEAVPGIEAHPAVVSFIQASLVLGGLAGSLLLMGHYTGAFKRTNRKGRPQLRVAEHSLIMMAASACLWAVAVN